MPRTEPPPHILIVDDEPAVRVLLRECFEMEGFVVSEAGDGAGLFTELARARPDLITLDLKLGGESGLDFAQKIRASCNVPIVMITGKSDTIDRVVGLELGADDYIGKPFHVREVLARVRAVLRRYQAVPQGGAEADIGGDGAGQQRFRFANWTLDVTRRALTSIDGMSNELTTAEFNMLEMFVRRPHRVLSRDNIMDLLKGHDWSPFDRSIDALVVRLRRKIEVEPETPRLIKTVRGVGYVFAADVGRV
jgi:two-component system, OmpR family, response regulator